MQRPSWQWEKRCLSCGNVTALLAAAALAATPPPAAKVLEMVLVRVGSDFPEALARMGAFTAAAATLWAAGTAAAAFGLAALLRQAAPAPEPAVGAGGGRRRHRRRGHRRGRPVARPRFLRNLLRQTVCVRRVAFRVDRQPSVVGPDRIRRTRPGAGAARGGEPDDGFGGDSHGTTARRFGAAGLAVFVLVLGVAFALLHVLSWHQATAIAEQLAANQPVPATRWSAPCPASSTRACWRGSPCFFRAWPGC